MSLPVSASISILANMSDLSSCPDDEKFNRIWDEQSVTELKENPKKTLLLLPPYQRTTTIAAPTNPQRLPPSSLTRAKPKNHLNAFLAPKYQVLQMNDKYQVLQMNDTQGSSDKDEDKDETETTVSSDSSDPLDSDTEHIRKKVWEQVRQAKLKRLKENTTGTTTTTTVVPATSPPPAATLPSVGVAAIEPPKLEKSPQRDTNSPTITSLSTGPKQFQNKGEQESKAPFDEESIAESAFKEGRVRLKEIDVPDMSKMHVWEIDDGFDSMLDSGNHLKCQPIDSFSFADTALFKASDDEANEESMLDSIFSLDISEEESQPKVQKSASKPVEDLSFIKDEVLCVTLHGSEVSRMHIPISAIIKQEEVMNQRALNHGVSSQQWTGSLLYRAVLEKKARCSNPQQHLNQSDLFTVDLYPKHDCSEANYRQNFQWQIWLNHCIESFYKQGEIRISDDCIGFEILVALQYFGILYRPEQLVFDSFATYLRVKLWSEYFSYRDCLKDWLQDKMEHSFAKHSHLFCSCPFPVKEGCTFNTFGTKQVPEVFDGGIAIDSKVHGTTRSSAVVYSFFNKDDEEEDPLNMDVLMREDFCAFLCKRWPGMDVTFPVRMTTISFPDGSFEQARLATLCVHLGSHSCSPQLVDCESMAATLDDPTQAKEPDPQSGCQLFDSEALQMCVSTKSRGSPSDASTEADWDQVGATKVNATTASVGGPEEAGMSTTSNQGESDRSPWLQFEDNNQDMESKNAQILIHERIQNEEHQHISAMYADHIYGDLLKESTFHSSRSGQGKRESSNNNKSKHTRKEYERFIAVEEEKKEEFDFNAFKLPSFYGPEGNLSDKKSSVFVEIVGLFHPKRDKTVGKRRTRRFLV